MKDKLAVGRICFTTGEPKANKGEIPGKARVFKEYYVTWWTSVTIVISAFMPAEGRTVRPFFPKYGERSGGREKIAGCFSHPGIRKVCGYCFFSLK